MKTTFKSIEEYCNSFPPDVQVHLRKVIETFRMTWPTAEESIRYGMPSFKIGKEFLYVSATKKHIGMYPMYKLSQLENEIGPYRGKGTKDSLHLPYNKPIPFQLIRKIILLKATGSPNGDVGK